MHPIHFVFSDLYIYTIETIVRSIGVKLLFPFLNATIASKIVVGCNRSHHRMSTIGRIALSRGWKNATKQIVTLRFAMQIPDQMGDDFDLSPCAVGKKIDRDTEYIYIYIDQVDI